MCSQAGLLYALCLAVAGLVAGAVYHFRARRADAFVRRNLEASLAEQERTSRELHDTLLQGIQGLILRFQAVAERIPQRDPARDMMERALERADDVLVESRDRANVAGETGSERVP